MTDQQKIGAIWNLIARQEVQKRMRAKNWRQNSPADRRRLAKEIQLDLARFDTRLVARIKKIIFNQ